MQSDKYIMLRDIFVKEKRDLVFILKYIKRRECYECRSDAVVYDFYWKFENRSMVSYKDKFIKRFLMKRFIQNIILILLRTLSRASMNFIKIEKRE